MYCRFPKFSAAVRLVGSLAFLSLGALGCGYDIPINMFFNPPPQIDDFKTLLRFDEQINKGVETVRLECTLLLKRKRPKKQEDEAPEEQPADPNLGLDEWEEEKTKRDKKFTLSPTIVAIRGDSVVIRATKYMFPAFNFFLRGDRYTLINHWDKTALEGSAADVQARQPDLALLPPGLSGTQLFLPPLKAGPDETAFLFKKRGHYLISYYQDTPAFELPILVRRIRVNRRTLLVEEVELFQLSQKKKLLAKVDYHHWYWKYLDPTQDRRVRFPCRVRFKAPSTKSRLRFKMTIDEDDVRLNRSLPDSMFTPRYSSSYKIIRVDHPSAPSKQEAKE